MLREDSSLPFLDMAWSSHQMAEFFNKNVPPSVYRGKEITAVKREKVAYNPGRQCVILYSLHFGDTVRGPSRWAVVSFASDARLGEVYKVCYGENGTRPPGPAPRPGIFLPGYGCLIEFFPMDWRLPGLAWASDAAQAASVLQQASADVPRPSSSDSLEIDVLRYAPQRRCVLRYRLDPATGDAYGEVVAKVYPRGPRAAQIRRFMELLHGSAADCGLVTPKPFALINSWNVMLMQRVPGTPLKKMLWKPATEGEAKEATRLAAAGLAALHSLRFGNGKVRSYATDLEYLRREAAGLGLLSPQFAQQVNSLLSRSRQLQTPMSATPTVIHGDYAPSQLLVDGNQVALVDFDKACLGDPAIDVGNFMAKLHKRAVAKGGNYRRLAAYFLSEYQERAPGRVSAEGARLHQFTNLLRMAIHGFRRSPRSYAPDDPSSRTSLLLQEAAECLAAA